MAGTVLVYLDVDDEITSAATRIRAASADRVALVLPYGSRLATSRMNFRLLAREATERGKQIEIICADASARALATAAGLPVYPSVAAFEGKVPSAVPGAAAVAGLAGEAAARGSTTSAGLPAEPDDADDTRTRVLAVPRRSSPRVPIVGPPRPPMRPRIAVALGVAVVVLVLLSGFLAVEVLPSATIVLHPRSEVIGPLKFTVEARPDVVAPDSEALVIPAQRIPFTLEVGNTFTATGVKVIETKAKGDVTFSSLDTGSSNMIRAGAIIETKAGVQFRTLADLDLPPAFLFPFFPSTGSVAVESVKPGVVGNVAAEMITVVPKGESKRLLQVTNKVATTGGEQRQTTEVSSEDVETATAAIELALATELAAQLGAGTGVPAGVTMFPDTAALGEVVFAVDPATLVGTEALEFDLAATAEGTALGVDPTPIDAIAQARLENRVTPGWTLVSGAPVATIGTPSAIGGVVTYPVTIAGAQVHDVDRAALLASIRGLVLAEARARLEDYGDVEITLWPAWVSTVPTQANQVSFTVGEPQPSQAP